MPDENGQAAPGKQQEPCRSWFERSFSACEFMSWRGTPPQFIGKVARNRYRQRRQRLFPPRPDSCHYSLSARLRWRAYHELAPHAMVLNSIISSQSSSSGVFPALVLVQGNEQKNIVLNRTPFSVGRKVDKDLVIADPRVSRDHALIVLESEGFFLCRSGQQARHIRQWGAHSAATAGAKRSPGIWGARFGVCHLQPRARHLKHSA